MSDNPQLSAVIHLYHAPRSIKTRIVKMVLLEKKVPFEQHRVNVYTFEDLRPVYKNYIVPDMDVLYVREGKAIRDFYAIFDDIESFAPEPVLMPADEEEKAIQQEWLDCFDSLPLLELTNEFPDEIRRVGLLSAQEARITQLEKAVNARPDQAQAFQEKIEDAKRVIKILNSHVDNRELSRALFDVLGRLEEALVGKNFLSGSKPGLADIVWACTLHFLKESGLSGMWMGGKYPRIAMFYSRFANRPSFKSACLEHSHSKDNAELVLRGVLAIIQDKFVGLFGGAGKQQV